MMTLFQRILGLRVLAALTMTGCHSCHNQPAREIMPGQTLPADDAERLTAAGWNERVGDGLGLWVSIARQKLFGIRGGRVVFAHPCSTAARGPGNRENSYQTPTGWHAVRERFGDGLPQGAVFKERRYTRRVWTPDQPTGDDLILSRILWLAGLEPGVNAGPGIDSHDRYIYIHGTPEEHKLGTPASLGCVRLSNADMIRVFEEAPTGTKVLISEW